MVLVLKGIEEFMVDAIDIIIDKVMDALSKEGENLHA